MNIGNTNTLTLLDNNNNKFITKLKEHFTEDEQQLYVGNLYMYMNYHPINDFVVNLENVWKFIGFSNKANGKRLLKQHFTENKDYKIVFIRTDENPPNTNLGGKAVIRTDDGKFATETIMMNVNTFKKLCLKSNTDNADKIHDYYVKLENVYNEIINDEIQQSRQELEENKRQLEERNKQIEETARELDLYKKKTYEEIQKTGHVYIIRTDGGYKVGKTKDINNRVKGLQTGNVKQIETILDFKTSNSDLLEKIVHYILDRYRCNSNREFFDCNINYIKSIVTIVGNTIDTLKSTYHHISNDELIKKLNNRVGIKINDDLPEYDHNCFNFYNWLEENIMYKENELLQLREVCQLYLGKIKIHSSVSSKYKKELERYIKEKYSSIKWEYGVVKINDITYNGWKHLCIKS